MADERHVIKRDGSAALGGPRPRVEPRPNQGHEAAPPPKAFGAPYSTDKSVVGQFEVDRASFEAIGGQNPTRRDEFVRSKPQPANPGDLEMLRQGIVD